MWPLHWWRSLYTMPRLCRLCNCDGAIRKKVEDMVDSGFIYLKLYYYAKKEIAFNISQNTNQRQQDKQVIGKGQLIAIIENPANYGHVLDLNHNLDSLYKFIVTFGTC